MSADLDASYPIEHSALKRGFDILFSLFVLLFGSWLYIIIGLLIYITSPGSVFYAHKRVGRGNKTIYCLKFRTMRMEADKILPSLLQNDPELKQEWDQYYKLKNDPRVLPIGNFLRKTSLDELPQFWNVLKGDLSVVGPRPCVEEEIVENFKDKTAKILSVRPGITGAWQISGRNNLSREERVKLEEEYIENRTFLKDLAIVFKTIPSMIFSKGAY